ncbi:hypothetical protein CSOJ01_07545 [Colletotrichum sojae]|uniref:Uncharacterized protein n=1 Tax=Colletotrichum sojae TaxID=2175907 RepID=A0A8H6J951_9PEZI|nr:hypothetical protein CSOJ01_07545 [Colletotrichum sojae]
MCTVPARGQSRTSSELHRYAASPRRQTQGWAEPYLVSVWVKPRNPNLREKKTTPNTATKRIAAPCKGSEMTPLTTNRPLMALKMMGLISQVLYSAVFAVGARLSRRRSKMSPNADEKKIMYAARPASRQSRVSLTAFALRLTDERDQRVEASYDDIND